MGKGESRGKSRDKSRDKNKGEGGSAGRRKGLRGRRLAAAVCAVLAVVAVGIALATFQPWNMAGSDADAGSGESSEWEGQEQGYVGPDGEGVLDRDDYGSDEDYERALIDAGGKEADIPKVPVNITDAYGYYEGYLTIHFLRSCGEERAREIVSQAGGTWVSSTFKWGDWGDGTASCSAYFEGAATWDDLSALCGELGAMPEVDSAYPQSWEIGWDSDEGRDGE